MAETKNSSRSLIVVAVATVLGLVFAWFAGANGQQWNGYSVLFICALVSFGVNWLAFIPAAIGQTEKYYDLVGAVTYLSIIGAACVLSAPLDLRAIVVAAMVAIWCIRLGSFLFMRISDAGHDARFDKIKINPARFLVAWTMQASWGLYTAAAALAIISASDRVPLDIFFWIGALVWAVGFGIEIVADGQKGKFRKDASNKGKFIKSGLWAWSQHPNYFGEIMLWTGILIIALPLLSGTAWLVLISPLFVTFLLTKVSGIAMLDKAAAKKWGDDPAYQEYRRKTPVLMMKPPTA
jgi:steroid 5-alpha reductase family enzyme